MHEMHKKINKKRKPNKSVDNFRFFSSFSSCFLFLIETVLKIIIFSYVHIVYIQIRQKTKTKKEVFMLKFARISAATGATA